MSALAAAETRRLFRSPLAWLVLALGQGAMAIMFLLLVIDYLAREESLRTIGVTSAVVVRYFVTADLGVLFVMPLLTMATFAADRQGGLLRFWFSMPLATLELVLGKLCGVLVLAFAYVVLVALMPATLYWGAPIDGGVYLANVLGLMLFTLMHASLGLLASVFTRQPLAAALVSLTAGLALWMLDWAARLGDGGQTIGGWSTLIRLRGFGAGIIASADIAYFVVATLACVVLAVIGLDAERRLP